MRTALIVVLALLLLVPAAYADITCIYDWEDCGTVLGIYPDMNAQIVTNVTAPDPVHGGLRSLKIEDNLASGTPQAYVAWITDLADGDSIWAEFWRYDNSPGASPSCRLWAHWNDTDSLYGYDGSASGNSDYGPGTGWDAPSWGWKVVDGHTGLVIECRTYSNPGDIVWIDDITIKYIGTGQPCIYYPVAGPSAVEVTTWGRVKSLFR